jgi:hypothetical protein
MFKEPIDVKNIDTKRLLNIYRLVISKRSSLICSCCADIYGDEDKALYEILGNEAQLLKDELNTRQHIPRKVSK